MGIARHLRFRSRMHQPQLKLNGWRALGGLRSFKEPFYGEAKNAGEYIVGERAYRLVIGFNGTIKVIPGYGNTVLRPFQLCL